MKTTFHYRTKQDLVIAPIFIFKVSARRHFGCYDIIRLPNYSTRKNICFLTDSNNLRRYKIQHGSVRKFKSENGR